MVKINVFKQEVPEEIVEKFYRAIGLVDLYDQHWFSKHNFTEDIFKKLDELLIELLPYYMDCKKFYIEREMSFNRYIQVLRQLARNCNMYLESKEYTDKIDKKKRTMYRLRSNELRVIPKKIFEIRFDD